MSDFEDSPSYQTVTINSVSRKVQIVTATNNSTKENYKKMLSKPLETFAVGDIVVWGSLTFLVTDIDEDQVIQTKGEIQLCNNTLSFYSTTTSTLYSIPCIITNKITLNESENKYITTVDNQVYMMVSNTSTTRQINPSEIFKLGIYNYEVVSTPDDISIPGILIFKMKYSEVEATTHTFVTTILNGATASVQQGSTLQLNVEVTDNGTPLSPTPTITYSSSNILKATVSSSGLVTAIATGSCVITATSNGASDTITVSVVAIPANNYTYTLSSTSTPDSEIKLNQTKTYTAQKYNNGVAVVQTFTFSVSGDTSAYTLTTVDGNNCTVKCLKSGYTVVLSATDVSDVTKVTTKSITLKSLF